MVSFPPGAHTLRPDVSWETVRGGNVDASEPEGEEHKESRGQLPVTILLPRFPLLKAGAVTEALCAVLSFGAR